MQWKCTKASGIETEIKQHEKILTKWKYKNGIFTAMPAGCAIRQRTAAAVAAARVRSIA